LLSLFIIVSLRRSLAWRLAFHFRWRANVKMSQSGEKVLKSTEKKRHYCCVCSNYRGRLIEGRHVTLHRFPTEEKLRKLWISRIKTVSQHFTCNPKNDRLCSEHFLEGKYTQENPIPCRFVIDNKVKVFKLTQVTSFFIFFIIQVCFSFSHYIVLLTVSCYF